MHCAVAVDRCHALAANVQPLGLAEQPVRSPGRVLRYACRKPADFATAHATADESVRSARFLDPLASTGLPYDRAVW